MREDAGPHFCTVPGGESVKFMAQIGAWSIWGFGALVVVPCLSACAGALASRLFEGRRRARQATETCTGELAMLRAVLASVPDCIYIKDSNGRFLLAKMCIRDSLTRRDTGLEAPAAHPEFSCGKRCGQATHNLFHYPTKPPKVEEGRLPGSRY